jgi:hypothetical protein
MRLKSSIGQMSHSALYHVSYEWPESERTPHVTSSSSNNNLARNHSEIV